MTIDDGTVLPYVLRDLTGIAKDRILRLRHLAQLGLVFSDDEPIKATFSRKVVGADELLERLQIQARRELGPTPAPKEERYL